MLNEVQKDSSDRIGSEAEGYSSMEIPEPKTESTPAEPEVIEESANEDEDEEEKK